MTVTLPPFEPLLPYSLYSRLSVILTALGLVLMAAFFMTEVTSRSKSAETDNKYKAVVGRFLKEVTIALLASFFLGFGLLFVCLCVGIYV